MSLSYLPQKYPNISISNGDAISEYCIIDSRVHGLYACFHCVLYGLFICEQEGLKPIVVLGNNHIYYDRSYGENVFTYFYKQEYPDLSKLPRITVLNLGGYLKWCNISTSEKLFSNALIKKYFILKDDVQEAIVKFCKINFQNYKMLGVHYRGRDKIKETPLLQFTEYIKKIDGLLDQNICDNFFFATDELDLRDYVKHRYKEKVILYDIEGDYGNSKINVQEGLHILSDQSPFFHAKDALMECYILSACHLLLSSRKSSMSLFPTFINPDIAHIIIEP